MLASCRGSLQDGVPDERRCAPFIRERKAGRDPIEEITWKSGGGRDNARDEHPEVKLGRRRQAWNNARASDAIDKHVSLASSAGYGVAQVIVTSP
jgi:hypothetical protein